VLAGELQGALGAPAIVDEVALDRPAADLFVHELTRRIELFADSVQGSRLARLANSVLPLDVDRVSLWVAHCLHHAPIDHRSTHLLLHLLLLLQLPV